MLLVNFRRWNTTAILATLVVMTVFFATFMPQTQASKDKELIQAVFENNITKAQAAIVKGARKNILLPKGYPVISLAIEHQNLDMIRLLMLDPASIIEKYREYTMMDHAIKTQNKMIIEYFIDQLQTLRKKK